MTAHHGGQLGIDLADGRRIGGHGMRLDTNRIQTGHGVGIKHYAEQAVGIVHFCGRLGDEVAEPGEGEEVPFRGVKVGKVDHADRGPGIGAQMREGRGRVKERIERVGREGGDGLGGLNGFDISLDLTRQSSVL